MQQKSQLSQTSMISTASAGINPARCFSLNINLNKLCSSPADVAKTCTQSNESLVGLDTVFSIGHAAASQQSLVM
jgi:hypothetical protein